MIEATNVRFRGWSGQKLVTVFSAAFDPKRTLATCPKASLSNLIRPMPVAANTTRKADHVEKRDPRGDDSEYRKHGA